MVAVGALEQEATALGPHALAAAARARRLAAPTRLNPKGATGFLRRKPPLKLNRRPGVSAAMENCPLSVMRNCPLL